MGEKIVWLDFKVRRSLAWQINEEQILDVQLRGFWLTHLTRMERLDTFVDFMVDKIQISMDLGTEQIEEDITSQVIQMRRRLKALQV